ncbi:hypothetical protein, partial [Nocardia sp. NPDC057353]|uniref:hypothetical protein n=1 Tax=Nocardia sp. NPDC057353 TaxID=3346104 RepID=UPI0036405A90
MAGIDLSRSGFGFADASIELRGGAKADDEGGRRTRRRAAKSARPQKSAEPPQAMRQSPQPVVTVA